MDPLSKYSGPQFGHILLQWVQDKCVFLVSAHSFITGLTFMHAYNSWWLIIYGILVFLYLQMNNVAGLCILCSTSSCIVIMAIVHRITNTINASKLHLNMLSPFYWYAIFWPKLLHRYTLDKWIDVPENRMYTLSHL